MKGKNDNLCSFDFSIHFLHLISQLLSICVTFSIVFPWILLLSFSCNFVAAWPWHHAAWSSVKRRGERIEWTQNFIMCIHIQLIWMNRSDFYSGWFFDLLFRPLNLSDWRTHARNERDVKSNEVTKEERTNTQRNGTQRTKLDYYILHFYRDRLSKHQFACTSIKSTNGMWSSIWFDCALYDGLKV